MEVDLLQVVQVFSLDANAMSTGLVFRLPNGRTVEASITDEAGKLIAECRAGVAPAPQRSQPTPPLVDVVAPPPPPAQEELITWADLPLDVLHPKVRERMLVTNQPPQMGMAQLKAVAAQIAATLATATPDPVRVQFDDDDDGVPQA